GPGPVPVTLERDGPRIAFGRLRQPLPQVEPVAEVPALLAALGVARAVLPVELYVNGPRHVFVGLGGEAEVAELEPDFARLARLWPTGTINCFAGSGRRWKTRAFAPGAGVPEDPATGSAAGPLACHLGLTGGIASGKSTVSRQLRALGCEVIDADQLAREVVAPGEPAWQAILEAFGREVVQPGGALDRKRLSAIVFADPAARQRLEAIVH